MVNKKQTKRKVIDGPIRNKERTRQKLIKAVGKIFEKEGYTGLNTVKIAATAKVDRKLIYKYFGSLKKLIACYFQQNDFWSPSYNNYISKLLSNQHELTQKDIMTILDDHFDNMMSNKTFRHCIQWEISKKSKLTRKVADEREEVGRQLFKLTDDRFRGSKVDLRAILALQIAGIYYLSLHAKINGSTFCGVDINIPEGRQRIEEALKQVVEDAFDKTGY